MLSETYLDNSHPQCSRERKPLSFRNVVIIINLIAKSFKFSSFPDVGDAETGVWCVSYLTPYDARLVDKWRLTAVGL